MKLLWFYLLLFFIGSTVCNVIAQTSADTFYLTGELEKRVAVSNFLKMSGQPTDGLSVEEIISADSSIFERPEEIAPPNKFPTSHWLKLIVANTSSEVRREMFSFCRMAYSVRVYEMGIEKAKIIGSTGANFQPRQKLLPSASNYVPFELQGHETKTFYVQLEFKAPIDKHHLTEVFILDYKSSVDKLISVFTLQSLYAGVMIMISLLSIYVFFLFRNKAFIYFAFLHLSFAFYFYVLSGTFQTLIAPEIWAPYYRWQDIAIFVLVVFASAFVISYNRYVKHFPRYLYIFIAISAITACSKFLFQIFYDQTLAIRLNNISLLIWLIALFVPNIILTRSGNKAARVMLISVSLLIVASCIYILALMKYLPHNFWTISGIQLSTIPFSMLLFVTLFQKFNVISNERTKALQLGELKSKVFANISHEFRTPLTLIIGPLKELLEKDYGRDHNKLLEIALTNSKRLLKMVNQILTLSRKESEGFDMQVEELNISSMLKGVLMSFESLALPKNITLQFEGAMSQNVWYDRELIETVIANLLSNALKFTLENGRVVVRVKDKPSHVIVEIEDNGIGIPKHAIPFIFDRFYQLDRTNQEYIEGSGIGLSMVKEYIALHSGEVEVVSEPGVGTLFKLIFKKGNAHFAKEDLVVHRREGGMVKVEVGDSIEQKVKQALNAVDDQYFRSGALQKSTILLIEDNSDLRSYLVDRFSRWFNILEASDGDSGKEKAISLMPEVIISDVMMPEMDGFEVCETLKKNVKTSHIPIILLTAKANYEDKIKGLEFGADAYLTKPFDFRELHIRINKLIELRARLREQILESPSLVTGKQVLGKVDRKFLVEVNESIETNLDRSDFDLTQLVHSVGLSQSQLNRKLKSLTGMTTNKYIQQYRLSRAMIMLREYHGNVSEVAYKTGFSSTAYFIKSFRELYGVTPGSILSQN